MDARHILIGAALFGLTGGFIWANLSAPNQPLPLEATATAEPPAVRRVATRWTGKKPIVNVLLIQA